MSGDSTGKLPDITSAKMALEEILRIAKDKRTHILTQDAIDWLELKMKVIRKFARAGIGLIPK